MDGIGRPPTVCRTCWTHSIRRGISVEGGVPDLFTLPLIWNPPRNARLDCNPQYAGPSLLPAVAACNVPPAGGCSMQRPSILLPPHPTSACNTPLPSLHRCNSKAVRAVQ